jgi:hypothetical protein
MFGLVYGMCSAFVTVNFNFFVPLIYELNFIDL